VTLAYLLIFISVRGVAAWLFRAQYAAADHRADPTTVNGEINGLSEQYAQGASGAWSSSSICARGGPGSSLYLVTTATGEGLAQAMSARWSRASSIIPAGWRPITAGLKRGGQRPSRAGSDRAASGRFPLLSPRPEERERLFGIIANAGQWSIALVIVLGLTGGFFVSRACSTASTP